MTRADLEDTAGARLDDPQLLVLAGGGQQRAVPVHGHAEDHLRVAVDGVGHRALADVPHDYLRGRGGRVRHREKWQWLQEADLFPSAVRWNR